MQAKPATSNTNEGDRNNQQNSNQNPSLNVRQNPNLMRIHADDQDKKTICVFWSVILVFVFLVAILSNYAVPSVYVKNNQKKYLATTSLSNCSNPSEIIGKQITCSLPNDTLNYGQFINNWQAANQFGLLYLFIMPNDLSSQVVIQQPFSVEEYSIVSARSPNTSSQNVYVTGSASYVNGTVSVSSDKSDKLYGEDGKTMIGYQQLLAILTHFDGNPFYNRALFTNSSNFKNLTARIQSYAINPAFTYFTIVLRYVYLVLSIIACILYFLRYIKIPAEKKIIQQRMIAVLSILIIMFNDPFYVITILSPNGVSAFFSALVIVNIIVFLMLFWLVAADRIFFQNGKVETQQLTKFKIAYVVLVWILLIVGMMLYSMYFINNYDPYSVDKKFLVAEVIIGIVLACGIMYIAFRFIKSCMISEGVMWRSEIYMILSAFFIFAIFVIVVSNSLILYNYSGEKIFFTYSLINVYVYYLQYMFTITREQVQKLQNKHEITQFHNYDVISTGTIDLVDVNLEEDYQYRIPKDMVTQKQDYGQMKEEQSELEKQDYIEQKQKQNENQFQSFDFD